MKKVRKLQYMLFIRENILYEMTLNIHFGCISIMPVTVFMGISKVFLPLDFFGVDLDLGHLATVCFLLLQSSGRLYQC